jgi:hypothetical protein
MLETLAKLGTEWEDNWTYLLDSSDLPTTWKSAWIRVLRVGSIYKTNKSGVFVYIVLQFTMNRVRPVPPLIVVAFMQDTMYVKYGYDLP